jgi:hypothetical protein
MFKERSLLVNTYSRKNLIKILHIAKKQTQNFSKKANMEKKISTRKDHTKNQR